ncbi:MAG: HYR domain-containing protein [Phycisphaerales bacterium]
MALWALACSPATAAIIYVKPSAGGTNLGTSWADAFHHLSDALAVAQAGDEIWLAAGAYRPDESTMAPTGTGDRSATFQLKNGVAILGGFNGSESAAPQRDPDANVTTLSGDLLGDDIADAHLSDNSLVIVSGGSGIDLSTRLSGLAFRGASGDWPAVNLVGASPTIDSCDFSFNCPHTTGVLYCQVAASPHVSDCKFSGIAGGSAIITGTAAGRSSPVFRRCHFSENTYAVNYYRVGAGVSLYASADATLIDCEFVRNSATAGGGAAVNAFANCNVTALGCRFVGNVADQAPAIRLDTNCNFWGTNCVFAGNYATGVMGCAFQDAANYSVGMYFTNCTFTRNDAASNGGEGWGTLSTWRYGTIGLYNCVLWDNRTGGATGEAAQLFRYQNAGYVSAVHASVQGWTGAYGGLNNNGEPPLFVRDASPGLDGIWGTSDDDYGDLRLSPLSSCIDGGRNELLPQDAYDLNANGNVSEYVPFDASGVTLRVIDGGNNTAPGAFVDRGAYEFGCLSDSDGDGVCDDIDNCPAVANPNQLDTNGDGIGDACQDTTPPTLVPASLEDLSVSCDAVPPPATVTAVDNLDLHPNVNYSELPTPGSCPGSYSLTRTWTATDASGNTASLTQIVTVADTTPPVLQNVPLDATVQCDPASPPTVTAIDNCDSNATVAFGEEHIAGMTPGTYQLRRTWTATDWCGNTAVATQTINVGDTIPPEIACPLDVVVGHDGATAVSPDLGTPTTNDACGVVAVTNDAPASFPVGATLVTWTAQDADGNQAQCTQQVVVTNAAPTAVLSAAQLTDLNSLASVHLSAVGSSDADDPDATLSYRWTVDGTVECDGGAGACQSLDVLLAYGTHTVQLRVTDPHGAYGEASRTLTIAAAALSVLDIESGRVRFDEQAQRGLVRLRGEIGLPLGVNYTQLSPIAAAEINVGDSLVLPQSDVAFLTSGSGDSNWTFVATSSDSAIERFHIDWKGARYRFHDSTFPVDMLSDLITTTHTELELQLRPKQIAGGFTCDIGGLAQIVFGPSKQILSSTVPFSVSDNGKRVVLTLPFPITDATVITYTGSLNRTVNAADGLTASVGRFVIDTHFDLALTPLGVNTTPKTIELTANVGLEGYSGATSCGTCITVKQNRWSLNGCPDD